MKKNILTAVLIVMGCVGGVAMLHAQDVTCTITNPDDDTVVPEAGIQLTADGTPAGDEDCLTFDWTDADGDWGPGDVSGTESNLMYYPEGDIYGTEETVTCTVTDDDGDSDFDTVNLIVPDITPGTSDLSYYDGYSDGVFYAPTKGGGCYSTLRVRINPDPTATGTTYTWTVAGTGGAITLSPDPDTIHCDIIGCGASSSPLDQDAQLLGPDGSPAADKMVTVHYPSSSTPFGDPSYATDDTVYPILGTYKGWETDYTMQLLDSLGGPMPDGAPNNESFDSWSGSITWYGGSAPAGGTNSGALPDCNGGNGTYIDQYIVSGYPTRSPQPVHYGEAGSDTVAASCTYQHYGSGSNDAGAGVAVNQHTLNLRRGHATQD